MAELLAKVLPVQAFVRKRARPQSAQGPDGGDEEGGAAAAPQAAPLATPSDAAAAACTCRAVRESAAQHQQPVQVHVQVEVQEGLLGKIRDELRQTNQEVAAVRDELRKTRAAVTDAVRDELRQTRAAVVDAGRDELRETCGAVMEAMKRAIDEQCRALRLQAALQLSTKYFYQGNGYDHTPCFGDEDRKVMQEVLMNAMRDEATDVTVFLTRFDKDPSQQYLQLANYLHSLTGIQPKLEEVPTEDCYSRKRIKYNMRL